MSSPPGSLLDIPSPFQGSLTATDSSGQTVHLGLGVPALPASTVSAMPSTGNVQSDSGDVTYQIEWRGPDGRDGDAAGGEREHDSSRSPVHRPGRGRSTSVGHRGHAHLGPRVATPEGASSGRASHEQTPGAASWVNVGTPQPVFRGFPSPSNTPVHGSSPDPVAALPGRSADEKLELLIAAVGGDPTCAPPPVTTPPSIMEVEGGGHVLNGARPSEVLFYLQRTPDQPA